MKEYIEFRILKEYAHLLFKENEGSCLGETVRKIKIDPTLPMFKKIGELQKEARSKHDFFFTCFEYKRLYTEEEINNAK